MAQFIIKRNAYKNAKFSIRESKGRIQDMMKRIREVGTVTVAGKEVQVKTLRQLRDEVQEKRNLLMKKQMKFYELSEDFGMVREKFT